MSPIAVLTSGGDAPGMNAALEAIVKVAASRQLAVIGIERGYDGLIDGHSRPLTRRMESGSVVPAPEIEGIGALGGTVLGSSRCPRFLEPTQRSIAADHLRQLEVQGLIVIGGNGSIAGAHAFSEQWEAPVVAIPASIDNDIGLTREALGVDTALNTIVDACDRISDTARSHHRAFVLEVMGRRSGYLAMAAAVATTADTVLLPESSRSHDETIEAVVETIRRSFSAQRDKRRVLIIKAEGVEIPTQVLVDEVASRLPDTDIRGTVLGHLVRGGNSSFRDRLLGGRFGLVAVEALTGGESDVMVAWNVSGAGRVTSDGFIRLVPIPEVLEETAALGDGTSALTRDRVRRMEAIRGVLSL